MATKLGFGGRGLASSLGGHELSLTQSSDSRLQA